MGQHLVRPLCPTLQTKLTNPTPPSPRADAITAQARSERAPGRPRVTRAGAGGLRRLPAAASVLEGYAGALYPRWLLDVRALGGQWQPRRPRCACATTCGYQASSAPPRVPRLVCPAARSARRAGAAARESLAWRGGGAQVVPLVLPELEELQGAADEAARLRRMFELVWAHGGLEAPPGARRLPAPRASGAWRGLRRKRAAQEAWRSHSRRTRAAPRGTKSSRGTLQTVGPGGLCDGAGAQGAGQGRRPVGRHAGRVSPDRCRE